MASRIPAGYQECKHMFCDNLYAIKDKHSLCVFCLTEEHAKQSLLDPESCPECRSMSAAQLQMRYRVARAAPKLPVAEDEDFDEPGPSTGRVSRGSSYGGVGPVSTGQYHSDVDSDEEEVAALSSMGLERASRPLFLKAPTFGDVDFTEFERGSSHGTHSRQLSNVSMATEEDEDTTKEVTSTPAAQPSVAAASTEPAGPTKTREKHPFTVTLEKAVELCGYEWPPDEKKNKAPTHALNIDFEGCLSVPEPPAPTKRLPVARGFKEALTTTWTEHKDPPSLGFPLETPGLAEVGTKTIPPMDPVLAQSFFDGAAKAATQNPFVVTPKELGFTDFRDKRDSKGAERSYRYAGNAARALNAAALSTGAMAAHLKQAGDRIQQEDMETLSDFVQLSLRLNCYAIQWVGKAMDEAVAQERKRWLDQAKLQSGIGKDLKDALQKLPVHAANLFEGGVEFLKSSMEAMNTQKEMAAGIMAPPPAPAATPKPSTRGKKKPAAPTHSQAPASKKEPPPSTSSSKKAENVKEGYKSTQHKPGEFTRGRRGGYRGK